MSYTVKVDGTTYYCADLNTQYSIQSATGEKQQELLSAAVKNGTAAEYESDLQTYDENSSSSVTANTDTTMSAEEYKKNYEKYCKDIGLSALGEDSDLDDVIDVYNKAEKEIKEIEREVNSIDTSDPKKVEEEVAKIGKNVNVVNTLLEAIGEDVPNYRSGADQITNTALTVAKFAAGTAVAVSAAAAVGIISTTALTVAGCTVEIPVAGWIIAGCALLVAGIAWLVGNSQQAEAEKKFNNLKEDLKNSANTLDSSYTTVQEKYEDDLKSEVSTANKELENLISDDIEFEDLTDTNSIDANLDKIIEYQEKFEPHYNLCQKYNFEPEGLNEFMKKMGTGDQRLYRAQSYLDKYATKAKTELNGEIGSDTNSLNEFYDNIDALIESAKKKGLKTNSLERIQKSIKIDNNKEVYTLAKNITSGTSTGSSSGIQPYTVGSSEGGSSSTTDLKSKILGLLSNSQVAEDSAQAVVDNSSAYDTSTEKLTTAQNELVSGAQDEATSYASTVSNTSGKSIEELYGIINVARSNYQNLQSAKDKIDIAPISSAADTAENQKQTLADNEAQNFLLQAQGTTKGSAVKEILNNLKQKQGELSQYNINTQSFESAYNTIVQNQQNYITQTSKAFEQQANMLSKSDDAPLLLTNINNEIQENSSFDVSQLQALTGAIQAKAAQLKEKEVEQLQEMLNKGKDKESKIENEDEEINVAINDEGEDEQEYPKTISLTSNDEEENEQESSETISLTNSAEEENEPPSSNEADTVESNNEEENKTPDENNEEENSKNPLENNIPIDSIFTDNEEIYENYNKERRI